MTASPAVPESERKEVQALVQSGRFVYADEQLRVYLERWPEDVELLYMGAVVSRYQKQFEFADQRLQKLKVLQPEFGRAYQEEGHLLRDQGKFEAAASAYQRACQYNPALTASWRASSDILRQLGDEPRAKAALAQVHRLERLPKHLLAVTNHLSEGRLLKAEDLCRSFLEGEPHNTEAMRLLAEIGSRLGVLEDADVLLESAIELEPDNIQLRLDYIQVLRKRQKFAAALEQAEALYERDPDNPLFASHLAIESMQVGDYERTLKLFEAVLEKLPNDVATLTSRGHALKTAGQHDGAVASYKQAISNDSLHADAWYALANLKTYVFSSEELQDMVDAEGSSTLSHMARIHFCFAIGKAYEDEDRFGESFEYYQRGNELKRRQTRYTTDQMRAEFEAQKKACTKNLFEDRTSYGCDAPDPIFIVGLPRAGSTLIEQILASHSMVDGTLELPNILSMAHRLRGRTHLSEQSKYPDVLHELSSEDLNSLGREYIETTKIHRQGAPFFTDKMPNNFRHLGLIHLILPNAKIIDARRDPMDCCWSGYKQLFAEGQEFTYSLEDIGHYYRDYVDLMDHWNTVLPDGRVLKVQHEDVLDDLEGQVRRILEYCNLPFESSCLDFYKNDRAVRTASSEQVRRPVSRSGQGRWKPFETYLDPLKKALGLD